MKGVDLYVAGTGSFAVEIAEVATAAGHRVVGFVEPLDASRVGGSLGDVPIVALTAPPEPGAPIVIGAGTDRPALASRLRDLGWGGATIVHPAAHVPASVVLGAGVVAFPGVIVGAAAAIGEHTLLGRGVLIGHHTRIGAAVTINPGANIAGNCRIGDEVFVGLGAIVSNGLEVGERATVAAGALVLSDVPAGQRVGGLPARPF